MSELHVHVLQVSRDVKEAVAYFSQHNRISQQVKEASIFRRPYFVGRFLPSLLSPCPSPEGIGGLIAALDRSVCC